MKRALVKSADSGWAARTRMAESAASDIDRSPPTKSSAERRMRATSPKLRVDEAGGGSSISREPIAAGPIKEPLRDSLLVCLVAKWMSLISGEGIVSFESRFACPPNHTVSPESDLITGIDPPCRLTNSIGHSSVFGRHNWVTSSSENLPAAKVPQPIARAESASACQACPMSCKQYRYARSPYFHASRHTMLVKTKTIGAWRPVNFISKAPRARCSAMCLDGS